MQDKPNIVIGNNAEEFVATELSKRGAIVCNLNKSNTGSQPFDQFAISSTTTWCYDVKHSVNHRFSFDRVETNQSNALKFIESLENENVVVGFAIVYKDVIYFLSWHEYETMLLDNKKSVLIETLSQFMGVFR